jgi:flagellar biogenesis protein FliO
MSFVSDIVVIGSAILLVLFSAWMLKQLFADNN